MQVRVTKPCKAECGVIMENVWYTREYCSSKCQMKEKPKKSKIKNKKVLLPLTEESLLKITKIKTIYGTRDRRQGTY